MQRIPVHFSGMEQIIKFVEAINKFDFHCDLRCGRYFVDAKSLMGVITLQGSSNVELVVHDDKADALMQGISQYCC